MCLFIGPSRVKRWRSEEEEEETFYDPRDPFSSRHHVDRYHDLDRGWKRQHDTMYDREIDSASESKKEIFDYGHTKVQIVDYNHKNSEEIQDGMKESQKEDKKETDSDKSTERLFEEFLEWKKFKEIHAAKTESSRSA